MFVVNLDIGDVVFEDGRDIDLDEGCGISTVFFLALIHLFAQNLKSSEVKSNHSLSSTDQTRWVVEVALTSGNVPLEKTLAVRS